MATQFYICTRDFKGYDRPVPVALWTRDEDLASELAAVVEAQFGRKGKARPLKFYPVAVRSKADNEAFLSELRTAQAGRRGRYAKLVCRAAGLEIARLDAQLLPESAPAEQQQRPKPAGAIFDVATGTITFPRGKPIKLTDGERYVLRVLVGKQTAVSYAELQREHERPDRILSRLLSKYPRLKRFVFCPGGAGKGGYSTTIKAAGQK
jgi:hypothetical protein